MTRMISHVVCHTHKIVKPCKDKIDEVSTELYYELSVYNNSQAAGKKLALED